MHYNKKDMYGVCIPDPQIRQVSPRTLPLDTGLLGGFQIPQQSPDFCHPKDTIAELAFGIGTFSGLIAFNSFHARPPTAVVDSDEWYSYCALETTLASSNICSSKMWLL